MEVCIIMKAEKILILGLVLQLAISYITLIAAILPEIFSGGQLSPFNWVMWIVFAVLIPYTIYKLLKTRDLNTKKILLSVISLTIMAGLASVMLIWFESKIIPLDTWFIVTITSSVLATFVGIATLVFSRGSPNIT